MDLSSLLTLVQIVSGIWVLVFGSKSVYELLQSKSRQKGLKGRQGSKINPFVLISIILAITVLVLSTTLLFALPPKVGPTPTPVFSPTPTPSPTPSRTTVGPTPSPWSLLLKQPAPNCHNPSGVEWKPTPGTSFHCNSELELRTTGTSYYTYAELMLYKVNGSIFNQGSFRIQVQITFTRSNDTMTFAGLAFFSAIGSDYEFRLNPDGQWQLQEAVVSSELWDTLQDGSISLEAGQPLTLEVIAQNDVLSGFINGQQVVAYTYSFDITSPTLRVDGSGGSSVRFANFELDG